MDYPYGLWQPNYIPVLEVVATIWLDASENGHQFTFYSQAAGGSQRMESVIARPGCDAPRSVTWADGTTSVIPAHSTCIQVRLGSGMIFSLVRAADFSGSPQLANSGQGYTGQPPAVWQFFGAFPPFPLSARSLQTVQFRINAVRAEDTFSVVHADTYEADVELGATGAVQSFDANGNFIDELSYLNAKAQVDAGQAWWYLRDNNTGETFAVSATDIFDGWQPVYLARPVGSLALNIFGGRAHHALQLRQFTAAGQEIRARDIPTADPMGGMLPTSFLWHWDYLVNFGEYGPYFSTAASIDLILGDDPSDPSGSRGFRLFDADSGEHSAFFPASTLGGGTLDLSSSWYTPPVSQPLLVSTTRWFHRLALRHGHGEEFPVINGATQGDTSFDPSGNAWWNDYGIFTATAQRRDMAGCTNYVIIDYTTGEISPNNATDLGGWVSHDAPSVLTAGADGEDGIALVWQPGTVPQGAQPPTSYKIRRQAPGGSWEVIATASPSVTAYRDAPVEYRVSYTYRVQGVYAEGRSLPASDVTAANFSRTRDTDGDLLPDWWEFANGLNLNSSADADLDADGDGCTNSEEYLAGTDPTDYYNGVPPIITLVSGDAQTSLPGEPLDYPLVVLVTRGGVPLKNAPVKFAVAQTGIATIQSGKIVAQPGDTPEDFLSLVTNHSGHAKVYFQQPARARVRSRITVTAVTGKRTARAEFRAVTTAYPTGGGDPGGDDPDTDPDGDWDSDGLTNAEEMEIGSDPQNEQSDDDGVADGADSMPADGDISFPRAGAPHYALIDIGPGTISGINGKGQVVGTVPAAEGSTDDPVAFFCDKGERKILQAPPNGRKPEPRAINDSGTIVGRAQFKVPGSNPTEYNWRAAHWATADSQPTDLGSLGKITTTGNSEEAKAKKPGEWGTSQAVAINNNGMIVGESTHHFPGTEHEGYYDMGDCKKAVRFNVGGKPTPLGPGKVDDWKVSNSVIALSEGGVAVGMTEDEHSGGGYKGAALWDNGAFSEELGEDFEPTGITTAPPDDTRYKYYVTGITTDIDDPQPSPSGGGTTVTDTGARLKLMSIESGYFVTKNLPTAGAIGITTKGLAFVGGSNVWRNGNDEDLTADISVPDDSTFDGVGVLSANGIFGGSITITSAPTPAAVAGDPPPDPPANKKTVIGEIVQFKPRDVLSEGFDPPMKEDKDPITGLTDKADWVPWTSVAKSGTNNTNDRVRVVLGNPANASLYELRVADDGVSDNLISATFSAIPPKFTAETDITITGKPGDNTIGTAVVEVWTKGNPAQGIAPAAVARLKVMVLPPRGPININFYVLRHSIGVGDKFMRQPIDDASLASASAYVLSAPGVAKLTDMRDEINARMAPCAVKVALGSNLAPDKIIPFDVPQPPATARNYGFDFAERSSLIQREAEFTGHCNFLLTPNVLDAAGGIFIYGTKLIALRVDTFIGHAIEHNPKFAGEDAVGATLSMKRIAAHEFGHFLTMSTRDPIWNKGPLFWKTGHDPDQYPAGSSKLMKIGTGLKIDPGSGRWTRHEDWKAANERAGEIVP